MGQPLTPKGVTEGDIVLYHYPDNNGMHTRPAIVTWVWNRREQPYPVNLVVFGDRDLGPSGRDGAMAYLWSETAVPYEPHEIGRRSWSFKRGEVLVGTIVSATRRPDLVYSDEDGRT